MIGKLVGIASLGFGVVDKYLLDLKLHNRRHFVLCTLMSSKTCPWCSDPLGIKAVCHVPHTMTHVLQLWYNGQEALELEAA